MAQERDTGESRKRSDNMILVGYFLSRCTDFSDGTVSRPPSALGVGSWNSAYDLFFDALSDGRSQQQFRHSLRNTRDIFDSLFDNGRKGWSDGQKRGVELSFRDKEIQEAWAARSDTDLLKEINKIRAGKIGGRNPDWTRDELLLVLDYHLANRNFDPRPASGEIAQLASRLATVGEALGLTGTGELLRTPDSICMKLRNFSSFDPEYTGSGRRGLTNGNRLETELWTEYSTRPDELARVVRCILDLIDNGDARAKCSEDFEIEAPEGRIMTRNHFARERNSALARTKKAAALRTQGRLICEVCDFDFFQTYGERGSEFIECHHTLPLSMLGEHGKTSLSDLALVCANCHRMIHARRPWWSLDEIRAAIRAAKPSKADR